MHAVSPETEVLSLPHSDLKPEEVLLSGRYDRVIRMNSTLRITCLMLYLVMFSLTGRAQAGMSVTANNTLGSDTEKLEGLDLNARDLSVHPGDDFSGYAQGRYLTTLAIPANGAMAGRYVDAYHSNDKRIEKVITEALHAPGSSVAAHNISALYNAYTNEAEIERLGNKPLNRDLDIVRSVHSKHQMCRLMGTSQRRFGASLFSIHVRPNPDSPDTYAVYVDPSGLGMPGRDYYLQPDLAETKRKYVDYVEQTLSLAKWPSSRETSEAIVDFETGIAKAELDDRERRDELNNNKTVTYRELIQSSSAFDMSALLGSINATGQDAYVLRQFPAFPRLIALFNATPLSTLKAWEAFHIANEASDLLPSQFVQARFAFYGKVLQGRQRPSSRRDNASSIVTDTLSDEFDRLYVARYFDADSKAGAQDIARSLITTLRAEIEQSSWLSPATKAESLKKIDNTRVDMGYPDKWRVYSFRITSKDLYGDVEREKSWSHDLQFAKLGTPVDRKEWELPAHLLMSDNQTSIGLITFSAAMTAYLYNAKADPAINYGAIGAVIGHELIHSFDDQGRQIDSTWRRRNWWTPAETSHFQQLADKMSEQYSQYEPLPGVHVKGALVLGEAFADTQGLSLALDAYHRSLQGKADAIIDGTTGDQRFFLSDAQAWAAKSTESSLRESLSSDPHPPLEIRVNLQVRNLDEWYTAFNVQPGDKLYLQPEKRVHLW